MGVWEYYLCSRSIISHVISRVHRRGMSLRRWLVLILSIGLVCLYYNTYVIWPRMARTKMKTDLRPHNFCPLTSLPPEDNDDLTYWLGNKGSVSNLRLLIFSSGPSSAVRDITDLLTAVRIKFKVTNKEKNLPDLIKLGKGGMAKYSVIIFRDMRDYYLMETANRDLLDRYCRSFNVGILGFFPPNLQQIINHSFTDLHRNSSTPFKFTSHSPLSNLHTTESNILRLLQANKTWPSGGEGWGYFDLPSQGFRPVLSANHAEQNRNVVVAFEDLGTGDDRIRKVILGGGNPILQHGLVKLLLLDIIHSLTDGKMSLPLTRYVLVDIDDIFVGMSRLLPSDVTALVSSQERISKIVRNFHYNLGFSGKYFLNGNDEENDGDLSLVGVKEHFWWFPHMWKHIQPHRFNNTLDLEIRMNLNKQFALDHGIPADNRYSVAPHHSGVYPVHEQLYQSWKKVWDVTVTSTEEYPNLKPARRRRGFHHSEISVLPRQTCGLFTKNIHYSDYPGGTNRLEDSIIGGELLMTFVTNPISIYMTHMPNYCCDRLAPYVFESVFNFIRCHTNLNLKTVTPENMAEKYFELFPGEKQVLWGNPCDDKKHMEIWAENKNCNRLPNFLVVGPQKTGTTALGTFLQLHPTIIANSPSKKTFEEVQFFRGDANYEKGIEWYMDFFQPGNSSVWQFEKSANYFDGEEVPLRARRLLPRAKIIVVILSPDARAYSWYHHMRAHNDPTSLNFTFNEVITANPETASKALRNLQARCLEPGKYALHLEHWLNQYRGKQIYIVDGEDLKYDPVSVLTNLQYFLEVQPFFDFGKSLVYDKVKGFYCMMVNGKKKCLGKGKGRKYPPMDRSSKQWLSKYYGRYNEDLRKMLKKLGYKIPEWLQDQSDDKEEV